MFSLYMDAGDGAYVLVLQTENQYCQIAQPQMGHLSHSPSPEAQGLSQNKGQKDGMGRDAGGCEWNSGFWTC